MTVVEVLAPLRIETRFVTGDPGDNLMLQLRVYPDDFSIADALPDPTEDEVALMAAARKLDVDEAAKFATLASGVGAPRAFWLMRTVPAGAQGVPRPEWPELPDTSHPVGLPAELTVWITPVGGATYLAATMAPNSEAIRTDMALDAFADVATAGLPKTWWLSFSRACDVGLGIEIDLGPAPPPIETLVVVGRGRTEARALCRRSHCRRTIGDPHPRHPDQHRARRTNNRPRPRPRHVVPPARR